MNYPPGGRRISTEAKKKENEKEVQ